jgi:hypothetical protein
MRSAPLPGPLPILLRRLRKTRRGSNVPRVLPGPNRFLSGDIGSLSADKVGRSCCSAARALLCRSAFKAKDTGRRTDRRWRLSQTRFLATRESLRIGQSNTAGLAKPHRLTGRSALPFLSVCICVHPWLKNVLAQGLIAHSRRSGGGTGDQDPGPLRIVRLHGLDNPLFSREERLDFRGLAIAEFQHDFSAGF